MNLELERLLSRLPICREVDRLKAEVDSYRPFPTEMEARIFQKFRLEWNYHSNAIEGNKLTFGETVAFLMEGLTAKGKPLKDHLDIRGHDDAIKFLVSMIKDERGFDEADIRAVHKMILVESYWSKAITSDGQETRKQIKLGEYKSSPNHVVTPTGETYYYATPEETPIRMQSLMQWLQEAQADDGVHPLVIAAIFHHRFVAIHPFDDGNGRMTRYLTNLLLMRAGFPPVIVPVDNRQEYYGVLRQADVGEYQPLVEFLGGLLVRSQSVQLKGLRGEDISEPTDLDKEISLLKRSFAKIDSIKKRREDGAREFFSTSVWPLVFAFFKECTKLDELFFEAAAELGFMAEFIDEVQGKGVGFDTQTLNTEGGYPEFMHQIESLNIYFDYEEVGEMRCIYSWVGFKKTNPPFDINIHISFSFRKYKCFINAEVEKGFTRFEKLYHESFSEGEIRRLVEEQIRYAMAEIKRHTSNA